MTPEKHLAAILTAWNETDGYKIYPALHEALRNAELDFDGVEDDNLDINFNQVVYLAEPKLVVPGFS